MKFKLAAMSTVCLVVSLISHFSHALNTQSHEIINEQAARRSQLDTTLKQQLGLVGGIEEPINGRPVFQWIRIGGNREDASAPWGWGYATGKARAFRHFHDPLVEPWSLAGLRVPPFPRFESSVRWAQRTDQDSTAGFGNYSWRDARRYYLTALRGESPTDREQAFADTFRALGQVMHLVVDASVPEHVRADAHPLGAVFGNYEYWVSDQHTRQGSEPGFIATYLSAPIPPDPALFDIPPPVGEGVATVPIARLFDSDRYTGANPGVTAGSLIGIAEVANANFLSEDTRHGQYPHPAQANLERYTRLYTKTGYERRYYRLRPGFGLSADPVAEECALNELTGLEELCVDPEVWRETARKMLPRAVGYSKAVLDYFFRAMFDFKVEFASDDPTQRELTISIPPSPTAETMNGTFTLYAEDQAGQRTLVPGAATTLELGRGTETQLAFTPADEAQIQAYVLVFTGTLGLEAGAVAGRVQPWEGAYIFAASGFSVGTPNRLWSVRIPWVSQPRGAGTGRGRRSGSRSPSCSGRGCGTRRPSA